MTRECLDYGSKVVGGVTPGRGGRDVYGVPVYDTVREITSRGARRRLRAHRAAGVRARRGVRGARERHQAARDRHRAHAARRGRADRRASDDEGRAADRAELPGHHLAGEVEDGRHRRAGGEHEAGVPPGPHRRYVAQRRDDDGDLELADRRRPRPEHDASASAATRSSARRTPS